MIGIEDLIQSLGWISLLCLMYPTMIDKVRFEDLNFEPKFITLAEFLEFQDTREFV